MGHFFPFKNKVKTIIIGRLRPHWTPQTNLYLSKSDSVLLFQVKKQAKLGYSSRMDWISKRVQVVTFFLLKLKLIAEFQKKNYQNNRNISYTFKSKLKWKWKASSLVLSIPLECLATLVLREVILVEWSKRKQNLTCALTLIVIIKWSCQICVIIVCAFLVYWISLDACVRWLLTYHTYLPRCLRSCTYTYYYFCYIS